MKKTVEKGGAGGSTTSRRAKSPNIRGGKAKGKKSKEQHDSDGNEDWALVGGFPWVH